MRATIDPQRLAKSHSPAFGPPAPSTPAQGGALELPGGRETSPPIANPLANVLSLPRAPQDSKPKNAYAKEAMEQGAQPVNISAGATAGGTSSTGEEGQLGSGGGGIDWTDGADPDMSRARAGSEECGYNIQSVVDPNTGRIVITSNNIRMEVAPMGAEFDAMFKGKSEEEIQAMIDGWQAKKNADDALSYGNLSAVDGSKVDGSQDLRDLAQRNGYYGSEQHMVWAFAASARTGGRIPPEFFLDFDPFGGTAGNGPEIQPGGQAGEALSTISMAHDTDWNLGRYMDVGPLAGLHDLNPTEQYQMKRMGMAGLFDGGQALLMERAAVVNPFDEKDRQRGETDDQIFDVLNEASGPDRLYRGNSWMLWGDENSKLNQNLTDWDVQYRKDYQRPSGGPADPWIEFTGDETFTGPGVTGDAIGDLNTRYAPG